MAINPLIVAGTIAQWLSGAPKKWPENLHSAVPAPIIETTHLIAHEAEGVLSSQVESGFRGRGAIEVVQASNWSFKMAAAAIQSWELERGAITDETKNPKDEVNKLMDISGFSNFLEESGIKEWDSKIDENQFYAIAEIIRGVNDNNLDGDKVFDTLYQVAYNPFWMFGNDEFAYLMWGNTEAQAQQPILERLNEILPKHFWDILRANTRLIASQEEWDRLDETLESAQRANNLASQNLN